MEENIQILDLLKTCKNVARAVLDHIIGLSSPALWSPSSKLIQQAHKQDMEHPSAHDPWQLVLEGITIYVSIG